MTRLLLDTHALLWWILDSDRLPARARTEIRNADNEVLVSAVSAIEVTTKFRSGKLAEAGALAARFPEMVAEEGFVPLPISIEHGQLAGLIAVPHEDPFDRLLIAQAQIEQATLVSNEALFDQFGVRRLW